jgi:hypothetical protein
MKFLNKTLTLSLLLTASLWSLNYQHQTLYKDISVMGMGGANVAIGGKASSLFYNPAGLSKIPKEYGPELNLININATVNDNILKFLDDMDTATSNPPKITPDDDINEKLATLQVIDDYVGKNIHIDLNDFTSYGQKYQKFAFGGGLIVGLTSDFKTHRPLHKVLESQGMLYKGLAMGLSYDIDDNEIKNLKGFTVAAGFKYIQSKNWDHTFSLAEILLHNDDFADYLVDTIAIDSTSTVFDLGIIYPLTHEITLGASILNIGGIGSKSGVYIPATINFGLGYTKRLDGDAFLNQFRVAVDYVDFSNQQRDDSDFTKRFRFGLEGNVFDGWFSTLTLRTGVYQGTLTYGAEFRLSALTIGYAAYTEELGAYVGQNEDKRQMVNVAIAW